MRREDNKVVRSVGLLSFFAGIILAQRNSGELRIVVVDPAGLPVQASGELVSRAVDYRGAIKTDADGRFQVRELPFGIYQLTMEHAGFQANRSMVEVRSEVGQDIRVVLSVLPVQGDVLVTDAATLIDPHRTSTSYYIGSDTIAQRSSLQPGRAVLNLVQSQPGWLLEANGVLHPRGSEYQVQYVIDGIPLTDNRSPAFAPALDADDVQSMNVMTANYPAEYGRKLGGVLEVREAKDHLPGLHGKVVLGGGSFGTEDGYGSAQYSKGRTAVSVGGQGTHTDRYLDPPVIENYTNKASSGGLQVRLDRELDDSSRLSLVMHWNRAGFLVPNERVQEIAGQRQDRGSAETLGQASYQRALSPSLLLNIRAMARDVSADLWANSLSTPIAPQQGRGFRETYSNGSVSGHWGAHEWKAGGEAIFSSVHESFAYRITDRSQFDRETPRRFAFNGEAQGREQSGYVQDLIRAGKFTFSAGLRWDHYGLLVSENAFSPRLGISWWWPEANLILRASYDRAFQTPAIENLLLASSPAVEQLNDSVLRLPVRPSRGNFYQAGFTKGIFSKLRVDGNYYRRNVRNFADDDLLLNTGVSFPIAFSSATIRGFEARAEVPKWGPFSGFVSYSNMIGFGRLPITGGLFLADSGSQLLSATAQFPITQDQRNTVRGRVRVQPWRRFWFALGALYGSGLPIELSEGTDIGELASQYGARILERVNFERGRVRPAFSLDVSSGFEQALRDGGKVRVQADLQNATDRVNVINFAGLFSGTAVAQPRTVGVRVQYEF